MKYICYHNCLSFVVYIIFKYLIGIPQMGIIKDVGGFGGDLQYIQRNMPRAVVLIFVIWWNGIWLLIRAAIKVIQCQ